MGEDRSPWGPAVIALVFLLIGAGAVVRYADNPAVLIVAVLCALVAGWYARQAALRYFQTEDSPDP